MYTNTNWQPMLFLHWAKEPPLSPNRAVMVLSSNQSDLAFCGHVCRRDLLDVNESAMTCDGREDVCKMHAVHKASGFRHLDGVWKLIVEIAVATRHPLPRVNIQFPWTHFL